MNFMTPQMTPDELGHFLKWFEKSISSNYDACETYAVLLDISNTNIDSVKDKLQELLKDYYG